MPAGVTTFLERRSLKSANRRLNEVLKPGMSVLDVGCGSGAITRGIAERVGPSGRVVGIDRSPELIARARQQHGDMPSLSFAVGEVETLNLDEEFDLVSAARLLQWLVDPVLAVRAMARAARLGGRVLVLDYNHEKIVWEPHPPKECQLFYDAFLAWRADAGFDNRIADRLEAVLEAAGLSAVVGSDQVEEARHSQPDFGSTIKLWPDVAATRGHQLVADGFLTEKDRSAAETGFRKWGQSEAESQSLYLRVAEGMVGVGSTGGSTVASTDPS